MAAMVYRCQHCGSETGIDTSLEAFEHDPRCGRCGLSASEVHMKMQDELATLMSQHLTFDTKVNYPHPPELPPTPPQPEAPPQITYISQHYHHSAHQKAPAPPSEQEIQQELTRHGISSQALLPSQLSLFSDAQPDQQLRLIQLWSTRPSECNSITLTQDLADWTQGSMQQEEAAAQARHNRMNNNSKHHYFEHRYNAEPYMAKGYEILHPVVLQSSKNLYMHRQPGYNRSIDPAYQNREWWMHESDPIEQQPGQPLRQGANEDAEMS